MALKSLTRETRYEKNTATFRTPTVLIRRYLLSTVLNGSPGAQSSTKLLHDCGTVVLLVATAPNNPVFMGHGGKNSDYQLIPSKAISAHFGAITLQ